MPKEVEVGWTKTGGYELRATYGVPQPKPLAIGSERSENDKGVAGVELRTATVHDGEHDLIYSGRLVRSKVRYRAKTVAELDAAISKTEKGSRRRKKLVHAKRRTLAKVEGQIKDILHKQSNHLVSALYQRGVQMVVIGDIRDTRKDLNYGKKTHQKLHGWSFGAFRQTVTYKAGRLGMQVVAQDEFFTSQTCPCCGERHTPKGREYRCECGLVLDRDVVGAVNIRRKYLGCYGTPVVGVYGSPSGFATHCTCRVTLLCREPPACRHGESQPCRVWEALPRVALYLSAPPQRPIIRGSSMSRSLSPSRLSVSTTRKIIRPGSRDTHGATRRY